MYVYVFCVVFSTSVPMCVSHDLCRSGVRLKSLRSGHVDLQIVLSDLSSMRQKMKDSVTAEEVGTLVCLLFT